MTQAQCFACFDDFPRGGGLAGRGAAAEKLINFFVEAAHARMREDLLAEEPPLTARSEAPAGATPTRPGVPMWPTDEGGMNFLDPRSPAHALRRRSAVREGGHPPPPAWVLLLGLEAGMASQPIPLSRCILPLVPQGRSFLGSVSSF